MTGLVRIGDWEFDPTSGELVRGERTVRLGPKTAVVLAALAARPGEVLPKEELLSAAWGERIVGDEVLAHALWEIRKALGDDARQPEYVETIPKRGYRLIAEAVGPPVSASGAGRAPAWRSRALAAAAAALLAVAAGAVWWPRRTVEARPRLWVDRAVTAGDAEADTLAASLAVALLDDLAGLPGVEVAHGPGRDARRRTFRLVPTVRERDHRFEVRVRVDESPGEAVRFTTRPTLLGEDGEIAGAASDLAREIGTYLRVREMALADDPDIAPWYSLRRHRIEAIESFLFAAEFVYRYEVGSTPYLERAAELDPDFVAPFVWRVGSIAQSGDPERIEALRDDYARLWESADPFEQAMIGWARAILDHDPGREKRHLELALERAPGNRILTVNLALADAAVGDLEAALKLLEGLIAQGWRYPWLEPGAAEMYIELGRLERAEELLEQGTRRATPAPETFALAELVARYRGREERARELRRRLDTRIAEMSPEPVELDYADVAELLAARADDENRSEVAAALRKTAF